MSKSRICLCLLFLCISLLQTSVSTRVKGKMTYKSHNKGLIGYLDKFGISKGSIAYVSGNIGTSTDVSTNAFIAFLPQDKWNEMNNNKKECPNLFDKFDSNERKDLIRTINPSDSTYSIKNNNNDKTEFWYLLFIFCNCSDISINSSDCRSTLLGTEFNYTLYIVNDNSSNRHHDPFTYQFPYNENGFLITFLVFALLYTILVPVHFGFHLKYTIKCQTPLLIWLFNFALLFEATNIMCGLLHYGVYSHNGEGVPFFYYLKGLLNLIGDWFLILVLILTAGGWMVTIRTIKWKIASFLFIGIYIFLSIVYYICSVVYPVVEPWDTRHPLQNWAGGIYLTGRGLLLFYVWYQIYHIHRQEEKLQKLRLYRVLFVIFTAWFWYLPIIVGIVSLINPVIAWVVLINFMNIMNFLVNLIMTALFIPIWSHEYFQFNHIMNSRSSSVLLSSFGFSKQYTKIGESGEPRVL